MENSEKNCLSYLPTRVAEAVEEAIRAAAAERQAAAEIRLRVGRPASLTTDGGNRILSLVCTQEEVSETVTRLCGRSMHAHADTIRRGYITLPDGSRAGICGTATPSADGSAEVMAVRQVTSVCLRLRHSLPGISRPLYDRIVSEGFGCGVLIYAPPGVGKTTVLSDLAVLTASGGEARRTALVDTRGELYDRETMSGTLIDLLSGYPKATGIEIATRTLGPQMIFCDEIGSAAEAEAILSTQQAGVPLIAAAHGDDLCGLLRRPGIAELHAHAVFGLYVGLRRTGHTLHWTFHSYTEAQRLLTLREGRVSA